MQVHCDEDVASRIDPESCAGPREGVGEALTGEGLTVPLRARVPFWALRRAIGSSRAEESHPHHRVARSGCPLPAPTERSVPISGTTLVSR